MALPDIDGRTHFAFGPHAGEGLMIELTGDSLASFRRLDPAGFRERCACAGRWFCETGCALGEQWIRRNYAGVAERKWK
jgi:hypothetical protein